MSRQHVFNTFMLLLLLTYQVNSYTPLVIEDNEDDDDYYNDFGNDDDDDSSSVMSSDDKSSSIEYEYKIKQANNNIYGSSEWPNWAHQYIDSADITPFSEMVMSKNTRTVSNDKCDDSFVKVELPLGPVCVKNTEFQKVCSPKCPSPTICWRGHCVDPRTNMCSTINVKTNEIKFIAC